MIKFGDAEIRQKYLEFKERLKNEDYLDIRNGLNDVNQVILDHAYANTIIKQNYDTAVDYFKSHPNIPKHFFIMFCKSRFSSFVDDEYYADLYNELKSKYGDEQCGIRI